MTARVPPLPEEELHVWRASLDRPDEDTGRLSALLGRDERSRAERFYKPQLGARYIVGRGLLRVLLGDYLDVDPRAIEFSYGEHGKPLLPGVGLWFNISHSGPEAVFAFSSSAEVGVDVELAERDRINLRVADRFFSAREVQTLRSLPGALQPRAFLTCWTRKEAFIKARGDGLSLALNSFDVTLAPADPPAVVRTAWSQSEPAEWTIVDLSDANDRTIAAAAGRHPGWRVVRHDADRLPLPRVRLA